MSYDKEIKTFQKLNNLLQIRLTILANERPLFPAVQVEKNRSLVLRAEMSVKYQTSSPLKIIIVLQR